MDAARLLAAAEAWIAADPDPEDRRELQGLIDAEDLEALEACMSGILAFGTAGIRGEVGAGSNRMNRAVVIRTTAGLAAYLNRVRPDAGPVALGFDARLSSRAFADDAIGVLVAAGIPVRFFADPAPTPLVAYAARRIGATAAVVITASHNPPQDNGYKVYDANAAQIIPPVDAEIAAEIAAAQPANQVERIRGILTAGHPAAVPFGPEMAEQYVADLAAIRPPSARGGPLTIVYTPLHGVGRDLAVRALWNAGFRTVIPVPEQAEPDGRFPTVAFPNPEEPGALDLAKALATAERADLILANDPDADRLAVCVPVPGGWRTLSGNQIGLLLADFVLGFEHSSETPIVINSLVSSPMLGLIAADYGAHWEQTLTGFKWICNAALDLEADGSGRFSFGFEEALGYSVGRVVRDKDGIGAAVWFADLAMACREAGVTVLDRLAGLYRRHGLWVSTQKAVVRPGADGVAEIAGAMASLRGSSPDSLAGIAVEGTTDYRDGAEVRARWLGAQALVVFHLEGGGRVLARPSGTEPKLKIYVDLKGTLGFGADVDAAESALLDQATAAASDLAAFLGFD
ncbi:MAG: phospho-sugar mutase [Actinobacteria bacterium]|nr:phospho-sugar mutase [Actinomycetota bacterium]